MNLFLAALLIGSSALTNPAIRPISFPILPKHARSLKDFAPTGWKFVSATTGDLNGDGKPDAALILQDADPHNVLNGGKFWGHFDSNPYIVAVAFANSNGGYDLISYNDKIIPRKEHANDQFWFDARDVTIKSGTLHIEIDFPRGNDNFAFRWQHSCVELIGFNARGVYSMAGDFEDVSVNFSTGKVKRETGNISSAKSKIVWSTLNGRKVITLDDMDDGTRFEPVSL